MLTLLILRHGKAAPEEGGSDCDRPLTHKGERAADEVGQLLRDEQCLPDRIITSTARRAADTARRVAVAAHFEGPIDELDELYLAQPEVYLAALRRLSGAATRVLIVGHNPGLEELVLLLTGQATTLPTAGLAVCSLPIARFADLSSGVRAKLTRQVHPKEHG